MSRVFLGHSSADKEVVRELYRGRTQDGVSCSSTRNRTNQHRRGNQVDTKTEESAQLEQVWRA